MTEIEGYLDESSQVVLDGSGNGTVIFDVVNSWQRWVVDSVRVKTTQGDTETPYPSAELYSGPGIFDRFSQGKTWTGNNDVFQGRLDLDSGSELFVIWTGGIPGTLATARVTGKRYTRIN